MSVNLDVFTGREIQNFIALCNVLESDGVTDIRFVRQRLVEAVSKKLLDSRVAYKNRPKCPECESTNWNTSKDLVGVKYQVCKDCQYSELV